MIKPTHIALLLLSSCGAYWPCLSQENVDFFASPHDFPEVFFLGHCSGVAIAPHLAITARHCVGNGMPYITGFAERRDYVSAGSGTSAIDYVVDDVPYWNNWRGVGFDRNMARSDFALLIFPPDTFKSYFKVDVNYSLPRAGQWGIVVGFGSQDGKGFKHYGFNWIRFAENYYWTRAPWDCGEAAVMPGDSGGAVLVLEELPVDCVFKTKEEELACIATISLSELSLKLVATISGKTNSPNYPRCAYLAPLEYTPTNNILREFLSE